MIFEGMCESAPEHEGREMVPIVADYTAELSLPVSGPELLSMGKMNGLTQRSVVCVADCEILPKMS